MDRIKIKDHEICCFERNSCRYFYSSPYKIEEVVSRLNKQKRKRSLNDIYKKLGLPKIPTKYATLWEPHEKIVIEASIVKDASQHDLEIIEIYFTKEEDLSRFEW